MLIKCPECDLNVSDKAINCPHCGFPMIKTNNTTSKRMKKQHKRLPNGFGQITCLEKTLRNPYRAMVTVGKNEYGKPICKLLKPKAYFATYNEAYEALLEYNRNPYDLDDDITVEELYERWFEEYKKTLSKDSSERTIKSAWAHSESLYKLRVKELRARHIKDCMDSVESPNIKSRIKSIFNLMLDYALEYELVDKNYARTFKLTADKETTKKDHIAFTQEEIQKLWNNRNIKYVEDVLIQTYTGLRPQELCIIRNENIDLDKNIIVGGIKTDAGTDRIIPIHECIRDIVMKKYNKDNEYLIVYDGKPTTYNMYRNHFKKVIEVLGLNPEHRPHDPRKTFVTIAKRDGVDEYAVKRIIGHKISDLTENVYTERDADWLSAEVKKIKTMN